MILNMSIFAQFVEPVMTHWIGYEFPNCGKWWHWHELCMGIKFQNYEEEIDILSFTQSTTATQLNYSVVENTRGQINSLWKR